MAPDRSSKRGASSPTTFRSRKADRFLSRSLTNCRRSARPLEIEIRNSPVSGSMSKTHKTAAVIIPPRDVWEPIQQIRRQQDRKLRRWMPHITLIHPFCESSQFQSVAEETAAQSREIAPFDVTLTTFNTFSHGKGHYTVCLVPEPDEPIRDLHAAVWTAVAYDEEYEPRIDRFKPHLSVGHWHCQLCQGTESVGILLPRRRLHSHLERENERSYTESVCGGRKSQSASAFRQRHQEAASTVIRT